MVSNAPKGASLFGNDYSSFTATIPIEGSRNVRVLVGDIFKGMEKIIPFSIKIITLFHSMFFFCVVLLQLVRSAISYYMIFRQLNVE